LPSICYKITPVLLSLHFDAELRKFTSESRKNKQCQVLKLIATDLVIGEWRDLPLQNIRQGLANPWEVRQVCQQ
jgi:hypothetical protein